MRVFFHTENTEGGAEGTEGIESFLVGFGGLGRHCVLKGICVLFCCLWG